MHRSLKLCEEKLAFKDLINVWRWAKVLKVFMRDLTEIAATLFVLVD